MNHYDVIVTGVGTMGAPPSWCLGSYAGQSRIISPQQIFSRRSRATVATGFSGHGFKFASAIGEIVADLDTKGKSDIPLDFVRLDKFNKQTTYCLC